MILLFVTGPPGLNHETVSSSPRTRRGSRSFTKRMGTSIPVTLVACTRIPRSYAPTIIHVVAPCIRQILKSRRVPKRGASRRPVRRYLNECSGSPPVPGRTRGAQMPTDTSLHSVKQSPNGSGITRSPRSDFSLKPIRICVFIRKIISIYPLWSGSITMHDYVRGYA